jgi:hypothetical protein
MTEPSGAFSHGEHVVAEPLDVPGLIGTEGSEVFAFDRVAFGDQLANGAREIDDVLDGHGVRQEVVVLQLLFLLVGVNLQEQSFAAEKQPLCEPGDTPRPCWCSP